MASFKTSIFNKMAPLFVLALSNALFPVVATAQTYRMNFLVKDLVVDSAPQNGGAFSGGSSNPDFGTSALSIDFGLVDIGTVPVSTMSMLILNMGSVALESSAISSQCAR